VRKKSILVSPKDPADLARNPYIAYNCIRVADDAAVVANGTHADMILERIEDGQKPGDAIALSLVAFGYERDELATPRIAGAVRRDKAWLGIAKRDEFRVREFKLEETQAFLVATYEKTDFEAVSFAGMNAAEIARQAYDLSFEKPVCAAAAYESQETGFDLAVYNPM
jgi:IMP cyclohydrolase